MMFIQRSQILIFLTIFFISLPTSFAGLTYQQIVTGCQNRETACVIAVAGSDHSLAVQSAVRKEDAMQCAISALGSQVCQYTKTGWVWVGCGGSILGIKFHNFNQTETIFDGSEKDFKMLWYSPIFLSVQCAM